LDFRKLEYFLHIANAQNITHAAEKANISQPALSRQIRLLEDELGVVLFERRARGVLLTEAGQRLQARAQALLRELGSVKDELAAAADEPFGTVTLAIPPSLRPLLTTRVVTLFRLTWPKVRIRVTEGMSIAMRDAVVQGRADVALVSSREPAEQLEREHLLTESLVLFAPPEVGLRLSEPVPVRSLAERDLILTPFPNALRRLVDDALVKAGVPREPQVEVDLAQLMVDLVRQGVGYGVLPYCAVHDLVERRAVSAAPVTGLKITWVVATARERPTTVAALKLIGTIRAEMRTLVGSGAWKTAVLVGG
jgi:LysR family transcriptional regulator, nitrogen assimilation regulatory protein